MSGVQIRPASPSDAAALADLLGELGYPTDSGTVTSRILKLHADTSNQVLLALGASGRVVGALHAQDVALLASNGYIEVTALIVSDSARGHGVGTRLLDAAEHWAMARGKPRMLLRSNATRVEAHRFYERNGWQNMKTGYTFEKTAAASSRPNPLNMEHVDEHGDD